MRVTAMDAIVFLSSASMLDGHPLSETLSCGKTLLRDEKIDSLFWLFYFRASSETDSNFLRFAR